MMSAEHINALLNAIRSISETNGKGYCCVIADRLRDFVPIHNITALLYAIRYLHERGYIEVQNYLNIDLRVREAQYIEIDSKGICGKQNITTEL